MGLLGLVGGVGKALLGGGGKKQTGPRMAGRMFRREGGRDLGEQEAPEQQKAQPTTPLVPQIFSSSAEKIQKAVSNKGGTETLEGTAFRIKTSVVEIDTLLKGSLMLDKMREKQRKQREQARRKKEEQELKKDAKESPGLKRFLPKAATSIWSRITKYFVTLFWGFIVMRLLNNIGLFTRLAQFAVQAANFIIDWGGKFLNFIVSFIDGAYGVVDTVKSAVGTLFGQVGIDAFEKLSKTFVMLLNAALIAAMVNARVNMGLNRAAGARVRNPGFWGPPPGEDVSLLSKGKVPVTTGRGGTAGLGRRVPVTGGGRAPLIRGARPRVTSGGKVGLQALRGPWKTSAAPIIKRIPLVGALMDFAINVFLFGESPARAAFKAIGAGLGAAIVGGIASIIPGIGTLIGAIGGGIAGDLLGGWIYDRIFGGGKGAGTGKVDQKTAGDIIQDFGAAVAAGGAAFWTADKALRRAGRSGKGIKGQLSRVRSGPLGKGKGRGFGRVRRPGSLGRFGRRFGRGALARRGLGSLGKFAKANVLTSALFAGMEFMDRKAMGQTDLQAGVGTGASTAGGIGGAWAGAKGGAALGAKIGLIGGPKGALIGGALGGFIGLVGGGILGSSLFGGAADAATGANKVTPGGEEDPNAMMPGLSGVFHKGGIVPMDMSAFLQGGEIIIDVDSAGPAKDMLLAINAASGYQGVMNAISQYAPYEAMGEKVVVVQTSAPPSPQTPPSDAMKSMTSTLQWSAGGKFLGGGSDFDPFEILHKGV